MEQSALKPRKMQAAKTRQKLFDTAIELFDSRGYENVSIVEICTRAGVSTGAFYHHFKSKDQILLEDFLKADEVYRQSLEEISGLDDYRQKMRLFSEAIMKFVSDVGLKRVKVTYHSQIGPEKVSDLGNEERTLYAIVENLYREGQEAGQVRSDLTARDLARLTISCYRGVIYEWCLQDGAFDVVQAGTQMVEVLTRGVYRSDSMAGRLTRP
jgi:TetR/AcrR family fatty acid metabolism transcriptional regulator